MNPSSHTPPAASSSTKHAVSKNAMSHSTWTPSRTWPHYTSQATAPTDITKLAEGGFNRVLLLAFADGFQCIAKIPYSLNTTASKTAQAPSPRKYATATATASEAATLAFLMENRVPVPEVYGYAASRDNPAGVEYILMEKACGVPIQKKWTSMTKRERHTLASSFVQIEKRMFGFEFPAGSVVSVYFKQDVPSEIQIPIRGTSGRFCIGPGADEMF